MFAADVRVPGAAFANEIGAVSRVGNHAAVIGNLQMKIRAGWFARGQHRQYEIVAAAGGVTPEELVILKVGQRLAVVPPNFVHDQVTREFHRDDSLAAAAGAQVQRGLALQRKILGDGGVHAIIQRKECFGFIVWRIFSAEGSPHVVGPDAIGEVRLSDVYLLIAAVIHGDFHRTRRTRLQQNIKIGNGIGGEPIHQYAQRVSGRQARD